MGLVPSTQRLLWQHRLPKQQAWLGDLRFMHIRPRDPALLPELRQHFARSGFAVDQARESLEVRREDAPNDEQAAREILLHVRIWQLMHPNSIAEPPEDP
jgi:hypothetical protein